MPHCRPRYPHVSSVSVLSATLFSPALLALFSLFHPPLLLLVTHLSPKRGFPCSLESFLSDSCPTRDASRSDDDCSLERCLSDSCPTRDVPWSLVVHTCKQRTLSLQTSGSVPKNERHDAQRRTALLRLTTAPHPWRCRGVRRGQRPKVERENKCPTCRHEADAATSGRNSHDLARADARRGRRPCPG